MISQGKCWTVNTLWLILKIYYLIQPRKRKISPKLNIHEQGFRKGKMRDKKFHYFQLFKFISAVFCRGARSPCLHSWGGGGVIE